MSEYGDQQPPPIEPPADEGIVDMVVRPIVRPTLARRKRTLPRDDISTRRFIEEDIGLNELQAALEFVVGSKGGPEESETTSRLRQMLEKVSDPAFAGWTITRIMKDCGVKAADIADAERQRLVGLAVLKSAKRTEKVLDDLAVDAQAHFVTCTICQGEGWVLAKIKPGELSVDLGEEELEGLAKCANCGSAGKVRVEAATDKVKLFLAVQGLGAKGGIGDKLVVNNVANAAAKADSANSGQNSVPVTEKVQKIIDMG
jgi:transcription elongation factor Elf1